MRGLYDGTPYELMPELLRTPENEAISYAVSEGLRLVLDYAKTISLYGDIERVSDAVLDAMALELRTQYYDPNASRKIREEMVGKTLGWYMTGGTNGTLEEYLATLYGGGKIEEWHSYGGDPYYFKAIVTVLEEMVIPVGGSQEIIRRINGYKNVRSWLEELVFQLLFQYQVPVEIDAGIHLYMEFYPRMNIAPLILDGAWKLDGGTRLSGYKTEIPLELYPVGVKFQAEIGNLVSYQQQTGILCSVDTQTVYQAGLEMTAQVDADLEYEAEVRLFAGAQADVSAGAGLYNIRRLDGTWKLDGTMTLNGGRYEL